MRIFLTGATGFVGTHLRQALVQNGHHVVALVRKTMPVEEGVTWVKGDITKLASLLDAMDGCQVVIHLAGITFETHTMTFERIHVHGTENVVSAMRRLNTQHLIFMSVLGAASRAETTYCKAKWLAEEAIRAAGINYTIFRPSIIFGTGDHFTTMLINRIKQFPFIPVIGNGDYPLTPISIHAVTEACVQALHFNESTLGQVFELCGPEVLTYNTILDTIANLLAIKKVRWHIPISLVPYLISLAHRMSINSITTVDLQMLLQESQYSHEVYTIFNLPTISLTDWIKDTI